MKKNALLPGGVMAQVKRRANGMCELCGDEYNLSIHHIIPRNQGGSDDLENLALFCKTCHNAIEDSGRLTREDLLRCKQPTRQVLDAETRKSIARKAAATRAAHLAKKQDEERELEKWDRWQGMSLASIPELTHAEAAKIKRPEKLWHVIVYGAGRTARIARE